MWGIPGSAALPPPSTTQLAPMQVPKNVVRVGEQALWSSQRYPDTTAVANTADRIFTTPRGQVGQGFAQGLTLAETNQKEGGRIPGGQAYNVYAIACQFYYQSDGGDVAGSFPIVGADLRNALNNLVLSWDFLQTQIEIAPASLIGAGGGIFGDTADTGAVDGGGGGSRINLNNGSGQLWVYQSHPVMLPADVTFAVLLTWGGAASVIDGGANNDSMITRVALIGTFQTAIAVG